MKNIKRFAAALMVLAMLMAAMPMTVFATEESTTSTSETTTTSATTESTTSTTKADAVPLSNLYVVGSNNKNYLADPSVAVGVDKYSFYLPDWMESCTLVLKSSANFKAEADGVEFEGSGGVYTGQFKLESKKNTFTVKLTSGESTRTLTLVMYLSNIPCKLESVSLLKGGDVVKTFDSEPEKAEYSFPSGTTSGVSVRIVPRHEQTVSITNLTGIPENQITGNEAETVLKLHETYKRYDHELTLVEGTNVFLIKVKAGTVEKTCRLTVIVGDAMANMTTTQTTESTTPAPTQSTTNPSITPFPDEEQFENPDDSSSGGTTSSFPPVLWVTIGVVIAVVIGACVFMIVNMGNRENNRGGYGDGYYDDYDPQPRYPARRNLGEYVEDDYGYPPPQPPRRRPGGQGGYYNSNSYNNYSDGYNPDVQESPRGGYNGVYGGGYSGSYQDDYDDGYGSGTPRGTSGSLGGFESDDDYGSGNYYGGY